MQVHLKDLRYMSTRRMHNLCHVYVEEQEKLVEHRPHCRHSIGKFNHIAQRFYLLMWKVDMICIHDVHVYSIQKYIFIRTHQERIARQRTDFLSTSVSKIGTNEFYIGRKCTYIVYKIH